MLYLSLENIIKHKVYILYLRNTDIFIHKSITNTYFITNGDRFLEHEYWLGSLPPYVILSPMIFEEVSDVFG